MIKSSFYFLLILLSFFVNAQTTNRISVFLDCSNTRCDRTFIRTELPVVDYSIDRISSDIHILLTSQGNGSGGRSYQIIMYGQKSFAGISDTSTFSTEPNSSDFVRRDAILKNLKLALLPFLIANGQQDIIKVEYTQSNDTSKSNAESVIDPWDYWVFRIGGNGRVNIDQNYENLNIGSNIRINRVTDKKIIYVRLQAEQQISTYTYDEDGITETTEVNNNEYGFSHNMIWSLGENWAYGYQMGFNSSTFSNIKRQYFASPSIEYNFFPYRDVNNKLLTLRYGVGIGRNDYIETTIYGKNNELLTAQFISLTSEFNQKWGNIDISTKYQHFLNDFKSNNLSFDAEIEINIAGGLSLDIFLFGALVHDQIYLAKGDATAEDVLTRQRELESNFEFNTFFGLNYRFGSKINNFINPRFGSDGF